MLSGGRARCEAGRLRLQTRLFEDSRVRPGWWSQPGQERSMNEQVTAAILYLQDSVMSGRLQPWRAEQNEEASYYESGRLIALAANHFSLSDGSEDPLLDPHASLANARERTFVHQGRSGRRTHIKHPATRRRLNHARQSFSLPICGITLPFAGRVVLVPVASGSPSTRRSGNCDSGEATMCYRLPW